MSIDEIEQRSFEFIEQHLDATFDEVPEYLFKIWHIPVPLKDYLSVNYKDKYEYRIFLYALRKYCKTYNIQISEKQTVSLFKVYQFPLSEDGIYRVKLLFAYLTLNFTWSLSSSCLGK